MRNARTGDAWTGRGRVPRGWARALRAGSAAPWCRRSRFGTQGGTLLLAPLVALLACLGCGRGPAQPWQPAGKSMIWPLPPDPPRIRYEGAITAGQRLRGGTGIFAVLDVLLGSARLELGTPHGIAATGSLIAFADSSRGALHLFRHGRGWTYRRVRELGGTPLRCPIGVVSDGQGGFFVSDSVLARVFQVSERGALRGEIRGEFVRPTGLAWDAARGRLYVVDTGAHVVYCFQRGESGFTLARTLGQRGERASQFNFPTHAAADRDGNLYVADSLNFRVQVFTPDGGLVGAFGRAGNGTGDFDKAKGVAIDSEGHIYVVDSLFDVVQIFDRTGRYLLTFGGTGRDEGLLWLPTGICIDEGDRIYVADSGNARVLVFQYLRERP